jgi:hypothetical protein
MNVEKDCAKELFLRLMFFGTYEGFKIDMKDHGTNVPDVCPPFVKRFQEDLKLLVPVLREKNPNLWNAAKNSRIKPESRTLDYTKVGSTFMSLYLQSYEFSVVDKVAQTLHEKTDLLKGEGDSNVIIYEFDGMKLLKKNVDNYHNGLQGVISFMNQVVVDEFKLPLLFSCKEQNRRIDLSESPLTTLSKEMSIIGSNHIEAVRKVVELKNEPSMYDRSEDQWYTYNRDQNRWEKTDHFLAKEYYDILKTHYMQNCGLSEQYDKSFNSLLKSIGTSAFTSGFLKSAKLEMSVDRTDFDTDNVINFKNGIYEIDTHTFRERTMDDKVIMSTRYDLKPYFMDETMMDDTDRQHKEEMEEMLRKIWPDEEQRQLMLIILASGFCPVNPEKFILFAGVGRNGKGVINNFMELSGGDYVMKCSSVFLTESSKYKSSDSASPFMADLHNIRYAYATEPPSHTPLQNSIIKEITGAVKMRARRLFKELRDVDVHCTLVCETNVRPPYAEKCEEADVHRTLDCPFVSQFTAEKKDWDENMNIYPINPILKSRKYVEERRNAFMNIILPYVKILRESDYKLANFVPEKIKMRSALYCNESVPYYSIFFQLYGLDLPVPKYAHSSWNKDPTVLDVVNEILESSQWSLLDRKVRAQKENTKQAMRQFFETNFFFRKYFYLYKKQKYLRGWRRREEATHSLDSEEDLDDEYF